MWGGQGNVLGETVVAPQWHRSSPVVSSLFKLLIGRAIKLRLGLKGQVSVTGSCRFGGFGWVWVVGGDGGGGGGP